MTDVVARDVVRAQGQHPKPSPVGPVDRRRVLVASTAVAFVVVAVMWVVRSLPDPGAAPGVVAFVLGLALIPIVASPIEWFVHRFVYHEAVVRPLRAIFTVHTAHHYAFFPTWRYVTGGPARRLTIRKRTPDANVSPVRNAGVRLTHFAWYMTIGAVVVWLPAWLLTADVPFLVGLVVASAVVSNLFIVVHDTIHRPGSHRIVEAQPWFAFLDRHHYIHHVALGANLNFLLPLADLLFGTLRTEMTDEELERYGSLQLAKARPVGEGERAPAAMA
jgi:hypothetical protein